MTHGPVVVFERIPRWTPELQRCSQATETEVRACSTARDVWNAVRSGTAVVILVLDDAEGGCLELLGRLSAKTNAPQVIVVGTRHTAGLEWPMRELGATAFVTGRTTSDELVGLCRRMMTD